MDSYTWSKCKGIKYQVPLESLNASQRKRGDIASVIKLQGSKATITVSNVKVY